MVYVLVVTAANLVNVALWAQPDKSIQSIAAVLALAININMAQAIVLNLQEKLILRDGSSSAERRSRSRSASKSKSGKSSGWRKAVSAMNPGQIGQVKVDVVTLTQREGPGTQSNSNERQAIGMDEFKRKEAGRDEESEIEIGYGGHGRRGSF
ncbi:hypothetical protein BT69DRAFT_795563 [Atractiella rhizophila]|nr:hypothetical protein BT69DRAFT_795563 [Atractiella rhizophila]